MLLTVDIGNTTVAVAGFVGERPAFLRRLPAGREEGPRDWAAALRALLAGEGPFRGAALSSVVPALTGPVADALACVTGGRVLTVGRDTPTGLPLGDYDGAALGMDRVVDCVAALARYAPPLAVFDMGTATTLSVVDREGVFRGGMILAGLSLSLDHPLPAGGACGHRYGALYEIRRHLRRRRGRGGDCGPAGGAVRPTYGGAHRGERRLCAPPAAHPGGVGTHAHPPGPAGAVAAAGAVTG